MRRGIIIFLSLTLCLCWSSILWAGGAQYNVGLIVVKQKDLAESLRQRITQGESFEALATANSVGPNARRGGRLGMVSADALRPEYRQALLSLKSGQVSKVIAIEDGYSLLTVFPGTPPALSSGATPATQQPVQQLAQQSVQQADGALAGNTNGDGNVRYMVEPGTFETVNVTLLTEILDALEFMQNGDLARAETSLNQALNIDPNDDSGQLLYNIVKESRAAKYAAHVPKAIAEAFTSMLQGDGQKSFEQFAAISEQNPKVWQSRLMEANLLVEAGYLPDALSILEDVIKINPDYPRTYLVMGNIYYTMFKGQESEAAYVKALQLDPGLADGHYFLARLYMGYGEIELSEQEYKRAIELNPMMYDAYNDLGTICLYSNRPAEAEDYFNKALAANPGLAPAIVNLGILYASQQKWSQAQTSFEKAISMSEALPEAYFNLGLVYMQLGKWDQAAEQLKIAAEAGYQVPEAVYKMLEERRVN